MANVESEQLVREGTDPGKYDDLLEEDSSSEEVSVSVKNRPPSAPGVPKKELNLRVLNWDLGSPILHFNDVNWRNPCSDGYSERIDNQIKAIVLQQADVIFLQGVVKNMQDKLKGILEDRYHIFFTEHRVDWKWFPMWVPTLVLLSLTIFLEVYSFSWLYTWPILLSAAACCPDILLFFLQFFYDERLNEIPSSMWADEFDTGGLGVLVSKTLVGYTELGEEEPFRKGAWCCVRIAWHPLRILEKFLSKNSMLVVKCQTHSGLLLALCSTKLINEDDGDSLEDLLELHWRLCDLPSNCPTILGGNFNIHNTNKDDVRWKFMRDVDFQSVTDCLPPILTWDRANPLTQSAVHRYKKNGQPDRIFVRPAGGHGIRPSMICPKCKNFNMPPRCEDCGEIILPGYAKGDKAAPIPNKERTSVVFKTDTDEGKPLSDHYGLFSEICFKPDCF